MALALPPPSAVAQAKTEQGLENALNAFKAVLTPEQRKDLDDIRHVPDSNAVLVFSAQLDARGHTIKGRSIASRFYVVLQCVRDFSSAVDTFVSSNPEIAALVRGSIKLTMLVAVNFLSYFEVLSELFMNLGRISPGSTSIRSSFRIQSASKKHSATSCRQLVVVALRRPWHGQLYNSLWQSLEQEFKPDMEDIQKRSDQVDRELELAQTQAVLRSQQLQQKEQEEARSFRGTMRRITGQSSNTLDELSERMNKQRARERRKQLLDSLSVHDHVSPHRQNCKKRHGGTAQWMFDQNGFEKWISGDSQVFWCSGKIGSGKTILTSSVFDHILTERQGPRDLVTFFFPCFDDQDSLKSDTILRSITGQAIESASITEDSLPLIERLMPREVLPTAILVDLIGKTAGQERRDLVKILVSFTELKGVKLFLSTRDTAPDEVRKAFPSHEHVAMGSSVEPDISTYITSAIDDLVENEDLIVADKSLVDDIKAALITHADGMFLWAVFQLKEICSQANDEDIRNAISSKNLPRDLTEIFARALNRVVSLGKEGVGLKLLP